MESKHKGKATQQTLDSWTRIRPLPHTIGSRLRNAANHYKLSKEPNLASENSKPYIPYPTGWYSLVFTGKYS